MRSKEFKTIIHQIKTLRIQGAEGIAREGMRALLLVIKYSRSMTKDALVAELYYARDQLVAARPTEPCLRNALSYVLHVVYTYDDEHAMATAVAARIHEVMKFFEISHGRIATLGAAKIRNNSVVFTHCHSSSVVGALLLAKKQGKRFIVYTTETRPMHQGRKTATELAAAKIPVKFFVDSAACVAMNDVHLCFMGADAITKNHVYNKIGSGMFAELLATRNIPLYICTNSWKFDPKVTKKHHEIVEERDDTEVWKDAPKGVEIENPAFEAIPLDTISSIISELGTLTTGAFLQTVKKKNTWMF